MASRPVRKTPQKTPLRIPSHGRGRLRVGGTNRGGPGRPPSVVRDACREGFADRVPHLLDIADGFERFTTPGPNGNTIESRRPVDVGERIKALDMLAKYGGLQRVDLTSDDEAMRGPGQLTPDELQAELEKIVGGR